MQQAVAGCAFGPTSRGERAVSIKGDERVDPVVDAIDLGENGVEQLDRRQLATPDQLTEPESRLPDKIGQAIRFERWLT